MCAITFLGVHSLHVPSVLVLYTCVYEIDQTVIKYIPQSLAILYCINCKCFGQNLGNFWQN